MDNQLAYMKAVNVYPPTITIWNRLEGRPRTEDFDRALKAEVRDALWMISKQWQIGEFIGDDAASPVLAKAYIATTALTKYQPSGDAAIPLEQDVPMEVKVEHRKIPFQLGQQDVALDLRVLMGRQWLKMIEKVDGNLKQKYIQIMEYKIKKPNPDQESDAKICAHVETWQQFSAVANRKIDGYRLYQYLKENPENHAYDDRKGGIIEGVETEEQKNAIDSIAKDFIQWFERLYYQPVDHDNFSWKPAYLEYQFSCSAPQGSGEKVLTADEYYHGHLDWYNLDIDKDRSRLEAVPSQPPPQNIEGGITHSFVPTSVTFGGMPHSRWWTFEDWKTNLSFIKPDTTDLNKLLFLDFALVYSNDWFLVPFTLPVGSLANVKGLTVTNVFGERTWIKAAGTGSDEDWQRWNMYSLNIRGTEDVPADLSLVLLPVARKVLEGKPLEEIFLLRDEIANMVWAVESIIPLATGKSKSGREAGYELKTKLQQFLDEALYGYKLSLISVNDVSGIPDSGTNQVIVAKHSQENILYFRIFDSKANKVVDKTEDEFVDKSADINKLKSVLNTLWDQGQIPPLEKKTILDLVKSITTYTPRYRANIRYQVVNSVPEQWIPFIPVHLDNDKREIQLQRAAMPRLLENDSNIPKKVEPRTSLLREGLDKDPRQKYFVHEEEVPRAGIRVSQSFQRTRWYDGRVFIWLGVRKQKGRGEGSSGLAFDQIVHVARFKTE